MLKSHLLVYLGSNLESSFPNKARTSPTKDISSAAVWLLVVCHSAQSVVLRTTGVLDS